ncbi:MAG: ferritin-like domain-containing protein [Pseudomonadota bacterium]
MAMNSLQDVYHDQLQDLYSACKQSLDATKKLADASHNQDLKDALEAGAKGIEDGMSSVKKICEDHDLDPNGEHCKGMEGLVKEAHAHGLDEEFGNGDTHDAMIITQYQRMVHYAIAGYGCLAAFAKRLGVRDDAAVLEKLLDDTYDGDRRMTDIATGGVNKAAAA